MPTTGGQAETYTYDTADNRLSHTDFKGQTTTYTYAANDSLLQAGTTTYTFDANGNRITQDDGTTRYTGKSYVGQTRVGFVKRLKQHMAQGIRDVKQVLLTRQ